MATEPSGSAEEKQVREPSSAGAKIGTLLTRNAVLLVLIATFIAFSLLKPESFFTTANVRTMVISQAVVLIIALGLTLPLRAGDMDISIAGVVASSAAVLAVMSSKGFPALVCVLAALLFGLLVGLVNAFFAVYLGVESFVVTLGMYTLLGGVAYGLTNSRVMTDVPAGVVTFASTSIFGLPAVVWYAWILVIIVWYLYEKTPLGRYMLFVGGNRAASRLAGVKVSRVRVFAFLGASLLGAVAGILVAGDFGAVDPSIGGQYLLAPFAAAFLGATTVKVGRFNAFGTLIALYLLVVGITGLQLLGAQSWVGSVFNGAALIISVALAGVVARRRSRA